MTLDSSSVAPTFAKARPPRVIQPFVLVIASPDNFDQLRYRTMQASTSAGGSTSNGGSTSSHSQHRRRRIQLSVRADGLKNVASKLKLGKLSPVSDPYALLSVTGGPNDGMRLGRTETLRNNPSPDWCRIFIIDCWTPAITIHLLLGLYNCNSLIPGNFQLQFIDRGTNVSTALCC